MAQLQNETVRAAFDQMKHYHWLWIKFFKEALLVGPSILNNEL